MYWLSPKLYPPTMARTRPVWGSIAIIPPLAFGICARVYVACFWLADATATTSPNFSASDGLCSLGPRVPIGPDIRAHCISAKGILPVFPSRKPIWTFFSPTPVTIAKSQSPKLKGGLYFCSCSCHPFEISKCASGPRQP